MCQLIVVLAILSFGSCTKTNENGSDDDDIMIVGPVMFDKNTRDVGVIENQIPLIREDLEKEIHHFIRDDIDLRSKIKKNLDEKHVDRYTPAATFSINDYSFLRDYRTSQLIANCDDFPFKSAKKAKDLGTYYRTECAGIEHFIDGNETPFSIYQDTYIYNNPNLLYFARWAYNLGNKASTKDKWRKLKSIYHGGSSDSFKEFVPFDEDIAVITFQDWGYKPGSIINDIPQKNQLALKYGTNRIYSPIEGVLIHETTLEITPESYAYLRYIPNVGPIPKRYYGFTVAINNRISLSGHTEQRLNVDHKGDMVEKYDFASFDKKVTFYKEFIKNLDVQKLYDTSKADWQK